METNSSNSSGGSSVGPVGGGISAPQDGSFETGEMHDVGITPEKETGVVEAPDGGEVFDSTRRELDAREIMDIPGTPHDKLEGLAGMEDKVEKPEGIIIGETGGSNSELLTDKKNPDYEETVVEPVMIEKSKDKILEELLELLNKLLEEFELEKISNRGFKLS